MVAAGLTNREIGAALFISESTAGVHVSNLMAKLGVGSRTEAAAWAYHAGLLEAAPGVMATNGPPSDSAPGHAPEPRSGWFGRLRDRLRQRDGRAAALSIGGVVVLSAVAVGLAIAVLNGRQPVVGDLPSGSASPRLTASASASMEASLALSTEESPTAGTLSPTAIPLPNGIWRATGTMSLNRPGQTATLLGDGTVLVAGGYILMLPEPVPVERYSPSSGEWTTTGDMLENRTEHSATLLDDGTVLVAGGLGYGPAGPGTILASAELFDPKAGTWHATPPMHAARNHHTATRLADGTVLVVGGLSAGGTNLASAEIYDPRTATWTSVAPMAEARYWHTATLLDDGTVLVAGGQRTNGSSVAVAALYHPDSRTWTDAGRMGTGRNGHTATLLEDGTVLVAGGQSDLGQQASAEVYHPSTKSWAPVGSMAEPRAWATATLLPDGTVLVAGGTGTRYLATAEVYNPSNGLWAATASMPQSRSGHTATRLASGEVLVEGGDTSGPGLPTVTFLYNPDGGP